MNTAAGYSVGSTSSTLLDRVKTRDPQAWREWTDIYGPLIYSWCRRSGLTPADAADVFQEVCTQLLTSITGFHKDGAGGRFRGWLWTITRNKIIDHLRKQKRPAAAQGGTDAKDWFARVPERPPEETSAAGADNTNTALLRRGLQVVRSQFEDSTWQAFWRAVVDGEPTAGIAADLGMSPNGVRQAKCRVLRRLREVLGDLADDLAG